MSSTERRPIVFHQLCAIARTVLLESPKIDNLEWSERLKVRILQQGYIYPEDDPSMLHRAMSSVEHACRKTMGHRPVPSLTKPEPAPEKPPPPQETRTHHPEGWDRVLALMGALEHTPSLPLASEPPPPDRQFGVTEETALNSFWTSAADPASDRLALLQTLAEIGIVRPRDWDFADVRANADNHSLFADRCFACRRDVYISWHHIIQIQHGGSNYTRNRVALCETCHAEVHPWLLGKESRRDPIRGSGWTRIGDMEPLVKRRRKAAS